MLKIDDYTDKINTLHAEGKNVIEIQKILGLKYPQPIYNYFKKMRWERLPKSKIPHKTKYDIDSDFFKNINTEEKAYILGFICADGHISVDSYRIMIEIMDSDYKLLESIKDAMKSTHPIKRHIRYNNPYKKFKRPITENCKLVMNGKELIKPLQEMGLDNHKTYSLNAEIMKYIPQNLVRHFLRGYFDGDGNVTWGKHYSSGYKYIINVCGNKEFLENSFQKYFPSNCKLYHDKKSKQCYSWKVANKKDVLKFLNYIYKDAKIFLERKFKIYQYAICSFKTELIAGNSYFIELIKGQSAANPLIKCLRQVQRLADETIKNPFEEEIEYNSATNAQHQELQINLDEDIVRTI